MAKALMVTNGYPIVAWSIEVNYPPPLHIQAPMMVLGMHCQYEYMVICPTTELRMFKLVCCSAQDEVADGEYEYVYQEVQDVR